MSVEERHQKVDLPCDSSPPNKIALEDNYKYFWIYFFFWQLIFLKLHYFLEIFFSLYKHYNVIFILDLFVARARRDCGNFPSRLPLLSSLYRRNNVPPSLKPCQNPIFRRDQYSWLFQFQSTSSRVPTPLKKMFFFWQIFNILL